MADMTGMQHCLPLQDDEYTVLESIYPGLITLDDPGDDKGLRTLEIKLPIALSFPTTTSSVTSMKHASTSAAPPMLEIEHLPPLTATIRLPGKYPIYEAPQVTTIQAQLGPQIGVNWLGQPQLDIIRDMLGAMWKEEKEVNGEGQGVLWRWWEWVGTGGFLTDLGYLVDGQLQLSIPPGIAPSSFHTALKACNAAQLHSSFELTAFSCAICLENRKGKNCVQMPTCSCVFCTPCLSSCWSLAIEEGTLENVSCPSVSCVKLRATRDPRATSQIGESEAQDTDPDLVESVVGKELRQRWQELKDRRRAEIDPTYTICPRPGCQAAVPPAQSATLSTPSVSVNSSRTIRLADISSRTTDTLAPAISSKPIPAIPAEDPWSRYRICPACSYSFCLYCSATWHGPHTPCAFPQTSLIVLEYLSYPENSEGRKRMEARRGRGNLEKMVRKWKEDEENKRWLESRTRACAGCGVRVEKSHGCNHMTCNRCSSHFCYRCGDSISPQDPYAHYRRPGHACFEKLFDQEEIERFERETAMGIAGIPVEGVDIDGGEWRDVRGFWEW